MLFLYNESDLNDNFSSESKIMIDRKNNGKSLINTFSDYHYDYVLKAEKNKDCQEFFWDKKILYENIFVDIFKKMEIEKTDDDLKFEDFNQVDLDDTNLTSFLSNINFIDKLCNICEVMRIAPAEKQLGILQNELSKINKLLPSNIYIPFLSESIRNYIIVHIPVTETRIFRTKNRAPYMLTVEVIRIDELI